MIFQIWLTIFALLFGFFGAFWLLVRRPVLRRIQAELELEREAQRAAEHEAEARRAAEAEIASLYDPVPEETVQQEDRIG